MIKRSAGGSVDWLVGRLVRWRRARVCSDGCEILLNKAASKQEDRNPPGHHGSSCHERKKNVCNLNEEISDVIKDQPV